MRLRRESELPEIPTSSMADIAFLLIIFFLLTTAFAATTGLPFQLPDEEDKSTEGDPGVTVWVKSAPPGWTLYVDRQPMALNGLLPYVDQRLRRRPSMPVLLYTDPDAPYQGMIEVYDELMRAQQVTGRRIENVYVPTTREVEQYTELFGFNPFTREVP